MSQFKGNPSFFLVIFFFPSLCMACGGLAANQPLNIGDSVWSCNGLYRLVLQPDKNLVIYQASKALWSTLTGPVPHSGPIPAGYGGTGNLAIMQSDGNFVLYKNGIATWSSNSYGYPGATLILRNDGTLVVNYNGLALWSSTTGSYPLLNQAAAELSASEDPSCTSLGSFFWEIGDASGGLAQGGSGVDPNAVLDVASASKLIFSTYVLEKLKGDPDLVSFVSSYLNFTSGYAAMSAQCSPNENVYNCAQSCGTFFPRLDGVFSYGPGHMLNLVWGWPWWSPLSVLDLGALYPNGLSAEVSGKLGNDLGIDFSLPLPSGGVRISSTGYANFLARLVGGKYRMESYLGSYSVCTNPQTCPGQAYYTPIPPYESWDYSLGHWVESDPNVGDGAFSSPGKFGFYPWIDATKKFWGIVAREDKSEPMAFYRSVQCGRDLRRAWFSGRVIGQ